MKFHGDISKCAVLSQMAQSLLFLGGIILLLSGCVNGKKVAKFLAKNPKYGATYCKDSFPCKQKEFTSDTTLIHDTAYIPGDSVACPPTYIGSTDSIYIPCPPTKVILDSVIIHDTSYIVDSAAIRLYQISLGDLQDKYNKLDTHDVKVTKGRNTWRTIGLICSVAIISFIVGLFIKIL